MGSAYITPSQLTPKLVLSAYKQGYFPMANGRTGRIGLYSHDPRAMIPLDSRFKVRRSLRQVLERKQHVIRFDTCTAEVIELCARHNKLPDTEIWLSKQMIACYTELAELGHVHSVECYQTSAEGKEALIGGLYGVVVGGMFCGESMFSLAPYGSQLALIGLVEHLREQRFLALDAQMPSEHLEQFGSYNLSHDEYMELLKASLQLTPTFRL